jgi:hypothetical protein
VASLKQESLDPAPFSEPASAVTGLRGVMGFSHQGNYMLCDCFCFEWKLMVVVQPSARTPDTQGTSNGTPLHVTPVVRSTIQNLNFEGHCFLIKDASSGTCSTEVGREPSLGHTTVFHFLLPHLKVIDLASIKFDQLVSLLLHQRPYYYQFYTSSCNHPRFFY